MTNDELKLLQNYPLFLKIEKTKLRIREWVDHYGVDNVYISFSGGKDSAVLLDIVRKIYPGIEATFIDTGLEYPEIKEFVKTFDNVTTVRPKMSFRQVLDKYGYPIISKEQSSYIHDIKTSKSEYMVNRRLEGDEQGRFKLSEKWKFLIDAPFKISDKCCNVMKKAPVKDYEKKTGKVPFIGIMAQESTLRKQTVLAHGCNGFDMERPQSRPMSFWTEQDVLKYIYDNKLPIAKVYGEVKRDRQTNLFSEEIDNYYTTGVERTGCVFCAYGISQDLYPNRYQKLKESHPQLYKYCLEDLGFNKVLDYINVKY